MTEYVKVGAVVTLVGFVMVASFFLYAGLTPLPLTSDEAQAALQAAKKWEAIQGVGWIVVGLGLYIALFGSAKSDTAIDLKSEMLLERLPPGPYR
jgi:hypothetical protein